MSEHDDDGGGGGAAIAIGVILVVALGAGVVLFLAQTMSMSSPPSPPSRPVKSYEVATSSSISGSSLGSHHDSQRSDSEGDWVLLHRNEGGEVNAIFGIGCPAPGDERDPLTVRLREGATVSVPHQSPHLVRVVGPRGMTGVPTTWTPADLRSGLMDSSRPESVRELLLQVAVVDSVEALWSSSEGTPEATLEKLEVR